MEYPPRRIINMLREGLIEEVIKSDSLLRCLACYACMTKCPRDIHLTDVLLPMVKEQALANAAEMPSELQKSIENMLRYGNPMGESARKRAEWAKSAGVPVRILTEDPKPTDVLWLVECYTSYYPRGQANSRATAKLFHTLGVDFAILGNEEKCIGECGQFTWESGLFETLTENNLKLFKKYSFNRVVTGDTHAYNALIHRYPLHGYEHKTDHTTQFFAEHIEELKPKLTKKLDYTVTYHDSCCLGRGGGSYDEARVLLNAIPGVKVVEMTHNRMNSMCCGGGGGGMWLDTFFKEKGMERMSDRRVKEAVATGADVLAVSCPYELFRFEDSLKTLGYDKKMVVRDVVELLVESLEA
jgi:Fe-S oxidoreductase